MHVVRQELEGVAEVIKAKSNLLIRVLDTEALTDAQKASTAVDVLIQALDDGISKCDVANAKLDSLTVALKALEARLEGLSTFIIDQKENQTGYFQSKIEEARAKAYGGCVVSAIGGPAAVAACYSIALGVIEGKVVPEIKAEMDRFSNSIDELAVRLLGAAE